MWAEAKRSTVALTTELYMDVCIKWEYLVFVKSAFSWQVQANPGDDCKQKKMGFVVGSFLNLQSSGNVLRNASFLHVDICGHRKFHNLQPPQLPVYRGCCLRSTDEDVQENFGNLQGFADCNPQPLPVLWFFIMADYKRKRSVLHTDGPMLPRLVCEVSRFDFLNQVAGH